MKKMILTAVVATMMSITAFAADGGKNTSEALVSTSVLNSFAANFAEAKDAVWTISSTTQKATFTLNNVQVNAYYDLSGEFIGTTQAVDYAIIPFDAKETIAKKYEGYAVAEVIRFKYEGQKSDVTPVVYFIDLKKGDASEVVLRIAPNEKLAFYKQVK